MKTNDSLPLKEYKTKRKNALMDCLYAIIAAILMMLPVVAFMYAAVVTYDDGEPASAMVMFLFIGIGLYVTGIILRLVYKQSEKSINEITMARKEYFTTADEADVMLFKSRKRKQKICMVSVLSSVFAVIIALNISSTMRVERIYKSAEELISQEKYKESVDLLKSIEEKKYKDTMSLITLCECYIDYEKGRGADAYYTLKKVNFYCQSEEQILRIREFEEILQKEHNESIKRMAENARKSYEEKKRMEESEKKTKSKSTYVPKYKEDKSDPYNAKDYRNEEDFYDDHYDDFFDYYDAEKYYREHHD